MQLKSVYKAVFGNKKWLLIGIFAMGFNGMLPAETVDSVSYNPSRMGVFSFLKVQDKATLRGGADVDTLNVKGNVVGVNGANKIQTGNVKVTGEVSLPSAELGTSGSANNYVYTGSTEPSTSGQVNIGGGTVEVTADSFIRNLSNVGNTKIKAINQLQTPGLTISGSSTSTSFVDGSGKGWTLGRYDIPLPNISASDGYEYVWQEVPFKGTKATVLTLQKDGGSGNNGAEPVLNCRNESYKSSHKAECCPSAAKTDEVCYKVGWVMIGSFGQQDTFTGDGLCPGGAPVRNNRPWPEQDCWSSCTTLSDVGNSCNLEWYDSGCAYNFETYECVHERNGW